MYFSTSLPDLVCSCGSPYWPCLQVWPSILVLFTCVTLFTGLVYWCGPLYWSCLLVWLCLQVWPSLIAFFFTGVVLLTGLVYRCLPQYGIFFKVFSSLRHCLQVLSLLYCLQMSHSLRDCLQVSPSLRRHQFLPAMFLASPSHTLMFSRFSLFLLDMSLSLITCGTSFAIIRFFFLPFFPFRLFMVYPCLRVGFFLLFVYRFLPVVSCVCLLFFLFVVLPFSHVGYPCLPGFR